MKQMTSLEGYDNPVEGLNAAWRLWRKSHRHQCKRIILHPSRLHAIMRFVGKTTLLSHEIGGGKLTAFCIPIDTDRDQPEDIVIMSDEIEREE